MEPSQAPKARSRYASWRIKKTATLFPALEVVPEADSINDLAREYRRQILELPDEKALDLGLLSERLGLEIVQRELGSVRYGPQALLIPRSDGSLRALVDPRPKQELNSIPGWLKKKTLEHRQRFLVLHEVAHTLFLEFGSDGWIRRVADSPGLEAFCDEFARSLLVPPAVAASLPLAPESIVSLHERYDVSVELAARAMKAAHPTSAQWILLVQRLDEEPALQWGGASREVYRPWRQLKRLADKASRSEEARAQGQMRWDGKGFGGVDALYLRERGQVIVTAGAPVTAAQARL